jgi:hypothetical protein
VIDWDEDGNDEIPLRLSPVPRQPSVAVLGV